MRRQVRIERALIIDDGRDDRFLTSLALGNGAGWEVLEADGGAAGVQLARLERPDVIVLDYMMPDMDGPAVLRALRDDPATKDIPVVMLTAAGECELERALSLGARGIIEKPFRPLLLADEIEAILGIRASHVMLPATVVPDADERSQ